MKAQTIYTPDFPWEASHSHLRAKLWIGHTLSSSSKVFVDAGSNP